MTDDLKQVAPGIYMKNRDKSPSAPEITPERIAELKALCKRASDGPWRYAERPMDGNDVAKFGPYVYRQHWGAIAVTPKESPQFSNVGGNMPFIAAAREAIPALIAEIERLQAERNMAKDALTEARKALIETGHKDLPFLDDGIRAAVSPSAPEMRWIPVTERLPTEEELICGRVVVSNGELLQTISSIESGVWIHECNYGYEYFPDVRRWFLLPPAPEDAE